jgi:predicted dehydrogenase
MHPIYTAAVIGAGSGGKLSMKALDASERYRLVAVADLSPQARDEVAALYPGVHTYASHGALLSEVQPDVVCVSTWPPSHRAVVDAALARGLQGILVEKPLADTWVAGRAILDAIRGRRLPMVTPHGLLVANHVAEIMERVRSGEIGSLHLIEIQCTGWDIINAGIHWLNFVVALLDGDAAEWVMASVDKGTRTYRDGMQVETLAVTYVQFRSGLRVVMNTGDYVTVTAPGEGVLFRLVGSAGLIEFYAWRPRYRIVSPQHPGGARVEVDPGPQSAHQRYLDTLAAQIDAGTPDYRIPESSLAALELCEAAYLSARHGCQVTLPLADFIPPAPNDWQPGQPYAGRGGGRNGRQLP